MIYLDHAATTRVDADVLASYFELLKTHFANPASLHHLGQESDRLLESARGQMLRLLGVPDHEVIFTSGATEAINLGLKGYALAHASRGHHLIVGATEHPAVMETMKALRDHFGFELTILPVDENGQISLDGLRQAMRPDTLLVALMAVNNETGVLFPVVAIADIVRGYPKAAYFCDTTQAVGKCDLPFGALDMFVMSGHKLGGLKGSGALIKRQKITIEPLIHGGGQERGLRSGTSDFPVQVMLAKALRLALDRRAEDEIKIRALNTQARQALSQRPEVQINSPADASPYILSFSLLSKKASVVVEALSKAGIMVSTVSACSSKKEKKSAVLIAMGADEQRSGNVIRLSFGRDNTDADIAAFFAAFDAIVARLR